MADHESRTEASGTEWKGLRRIGGVAFFLAGCLALSSFVYAAYTGMNFTSEVLQAGMISGFNTPVYLNVTVLQIGVVPFPSTMEQSLQLVASHNVDVFVADVLALIMYLVLVPAVLGLYVSLNRVNRAGSTTALAFALVGIIAWVSSAGMLVSCNSIADAYVSAPTDALRSAYLAQAHTVFPALNFIDYYLVNFLLYVSVLIASLIMLQGSLDRIAAYIGIVAGAFGLILILAFVPDVVSPILFVVWFFVMGFRLYAPRGLTKRS